MLSDLLLNRASTEHWSPSSPRPATSFALHCKPEQLHCNAKSNTTTRIKLLRWLLTSCPINACIILDLRWARDKLTHHATTDPGVPWRRDMEQMCATPFLHFLVQDLKIVTSIIIILISPFTCLWKSSEEIKRSTLFCKQSNGHNWKKAALMLVIFCWNKLNQLQTTCLHQSVILLLVEFLSFSWADFYLDHISRDGMEYLPFNLTTAINIHLYY